MNANPARRKAAEESLENWFNVYVRPYYSFNLPPPAFHVELFGRIDKALLPRGRFAGCLAREHAKTTVGTEVTAAYAIASGRKKHVLVLGANASESERKLDAAVDLLLNNPRVLADYGTEILPEYDERKKRNIKDSDYEVRFGNGATLRALQRNAKLRGTKTLKYRPDLALLDDVEDDYTAASQIESDKFFNWLNGALLGSLDSDLGSLLWWGTPLHGFAYFDQIVDPEGELKPEWDKYYAPMYDEDTGVFLWPERWNHEKMLWTRNDRGEEAFEKEYMCRLRPANSSVFHREMFRFYNIYTERRYDGDALFVRDQATDKWARISTIVMALDPAFGLDRLNDYSAFCIIGRQESSRLSWVLEMRREKLSADAIVELAKELYLRWRPQMLGVEKNVAQELLCQKVEDAGLPVYRLAPHDNKKLRVIALSRPFDQGLVLLPQVSQCRETRWFMDEAERFPKGRHDDMLDAMAHAMNLLEMGSSAGAKRILRPEGARGQAFAGL